MNQFLETLMLVCFGFSWPMTVYKSYISRTAESTSLFFILLILTGYVCGISAKILNGTFNYVFYVYVLNIGIVFLNLLVYIRNKHLDNLRQEQKELAL